MMIVNKQRFNAQVTALELGYGIIGCGPFYLINIWFGDNPERSLYLPCLRWWRQMGFTSCSFIHWGTARINARTASLNSLPWAMPASPT